MNAREKVFRPPWEFLAKDPVATCPFRAADGDGILRLNKNNWSAPAERSGDGALDCGFKQTDPKRCRAALTTALHIFSLVLATSFASACYRHQSPTPSPSQTRVVTDEAGRQIQLPQKIDRIVSLAPNLTEIVYAVGAGDRLVGVTSYCDYPAEAKAITKVGDTMKPSIERIIALRPQIVLVSTASQLEGFTRQLDEQRIAVYVTNPNSIDQIFKSIETLGDLFGTSEQAGKLAADLRRRTQAVEAAVANRPPVRVFYQVSDEPLYTIGREAFLTDLIRRAGGISVTADVPTAFPRYSDEAALASRPEAIILPTGGSMGNSNSTVAPALRNSPAVKNQRIYKINDDLLARPGPRLIDGLEELSRAIHPEAFSS